MSHHNWMPVLGLFVFGSLASLTWAQTTQPAPATRPAVGGILDPNVIAVGEWSEAVDGLRGRLVVIEGDGDWGRETVTYLELQRVTTKARLWRDALNVYVDVNLHLKSEMRDGGGQLVPPEMQGFVGGQDIGPPDAVWVVLPSDCTIRLRLSLRGTVGKGGVRVGVGHNEWNLKFNAPGEYAFSGTFAGDPPKDGDHPAAWSGTLKLPPLKIPVKERAK